jgi:serine protease Do
VARSLRRAVGLPEREGLLIHAVAGDSPAERAELRAGDLIVGAGEAPIDGVDGLYAALDRVGADGRIDLRVVRGVEEHTVGVELGSPR